MALGGTMSMTRAKGLALLSLMALTLVGVAAQGAGQQGSGSGGSSGSRSASPARGAATVRAGEWRTYGADLANTRYAPLDQINQHNFGTLEIAWRFPTTVVGPMRTSRRRR